MVHTHYIRSTHNNTSLHHHLASVRIVMGCTLWQFFFRKCWWLVTSHEMLEIQNANYHKWLNIRDYIIILKKKVKEYVPGIFIIWVIIRTLWFTDYFVFISLFFNHLCDVFFWNKKYPKPKLGGAGGYLNKSNRV